MAVEILRQVENFSKSNCDTLHQYHIPTNTFRNTYLLLLNPAKETMPSPRKTRSRNAGQHPGLVIKANKRRTSAEVKAAAEAKQAAKEAKKEAKIASIQRAAKFESAAMGNEDLIDATPRPNVSSKPNALAMDAASETEARLTTSDVDMSDGPDLDKHTYIPPDYSTEDDLVGSEGSAEETPMPSSKKRKAAQTAAAESIPDGPKAGKRVALTRSFAIADLADEAPLNHGRHDNTKNRMRQPKLRPVDHDTSPARADGDITSDNDPLPPQTKKPQAKKTAPRPVETTENSNAPALSKKAKAKAEEEKEAEEKKKTKKKKESIRDAIEAAKGTVMDGIDSDPRNRPSVDNAPRPLDTKGKAPAIHLKGEPMHFGSGPQWVPKGGKTRDQGMGREPAPVLSKNRESIRRFNQTVIDIESGDEQVPANATR
jgi:hypothetical protein